MKNYLTGLTRISLLLIGLFFFSTAFAQEGKITVKGIVKDQQGETIIGLSVVEQGTTNGVITNLDGTYTITVSPDANLEFSFIGYLKQVVSVAGRQEISLVMKENIEQLNEVVVIGYGSVKKEDLTGSVIAIKADEINRGAITSPQELLQGKISGVFVRPGSGQPGAGISMRIRSGASLNASNDPLIVIDGVPVSNDAAPGMSNGLATVNPNDIETMTVLKDASATAIYGSRASNGVIIITTKKGTSGKTNVSYSSIYSLNDPYKKVKTMNAEEYRKAVTNVFGNDVAAMAILNQYPNQSTNWQDQVYRTSFSTDHNLSVSGNTLNTPYRVSVGYSHEDGTIKVSSFERFTADLSINPKFFDNHLSISLNIKGSINNNVNIDGGVVGAAAFYDPTKPMYNTDGAYNSYWNWTNPNGSPNVLSGTNPLSVLYDYNDKNKTHRSIGNLQADYKFHFLPDLRFNINLGYDIAKGRGNDKGVKVNSFQAAKNTDFPNIGSVEDWEQFRRSQLMDIYLNYEKEIEQIKSRFSVMGGYSWQWFYRSNYSLFHTPAGHTQETAPTGWEWDEDADYYINRDNSLRIPDEYYLISFFGRLNYTLMNRYLLTATIRRDGSSRFSSDNRWGIFPSLALAWSITNEPFMKKQQLFSTLKLRLSYGRTGQQDVGDYYAYIPSYIFSTNPNSTYLGSGLLKPEGYNPNLKWESTDTYNVGVDFGFLNNRINGTIDVYKKKTKDLLVRSDVAAGTNFSNRMYMNIGNMENHGVEFNINANVLYINDFSWNAGFNATWNKSEITKLTAANNPDYDGIETSGISAGTGGNIGRHRVGYAPYTFYTFQQVYATDGKPIQNAFVDRNGDGEITDADKYMKHSPMPDWYLGFSSQFKYKKWDLGFNLRANIGNYVFNDVLGGNSTVANAYGGQGALSNLYQDVVKTGFTQANDKNQNFSDYFLENASFLKMDNLTLGYSFENLFKTKIAGRISFSMQNVFTITDYSGLDPEVPGSGGVDNNIWPRPKTYTLGLNINF